MSEILFDEIPSPQIIFPVSNHSWPCSILKARQSGIPLRPSSRVGRPRDFGISPPLDLKIQSSSRIFVDTQRASSKEEEMEKQLNELKKSLEKSLPLSFSQEIANDV